MSFDWTEYYNLAKELAGDENCKANEEAKNRTAISRAYYSAIIQARAKISKIKSKKPPFGNTHKWTIDEYRSYPDNQAKRIGTWLERLKKRREKADYDDHILNLKSELISALKEADIIISEVKYLK